MKKIIKVYLLLQILVLIVVLFLPISTRHASEFQVLTSEPSGLEFHILEQEKFRLEVDTLQVFETQKEK